MGKKEISIDVPAIASKICDTANRWLTDIDAGIAHEQSFPEFHASLPEKGKSAKIKTAIYIACRELTAPIDAAIVVFTGETRHGRRVSGKERVLAVGGVVGSMAKIPKAIQWGGRGLTVAKLGKEAYDHKQANQKAT